MDTLSATYGKLNDGSWGLRVTGGTPAVGTVLTVTKKDGSTKQEKVGGVLWQGTTKSGQPGALCTIAGQSGQRSRSRREGVTYERGVGLVCDECGERATPGTRCWETGARH